MNTQFRCERDLQLDLARHLREVGYLTFTEIQLPSFDPGRLDVVAIKPHQYANSCLKGYEVKLHRAVFLQDVQSQKYTRYMETVNQLYFAAPQGVITKADIPPDTGLIVRTENGWFVQKAPRILRAAKLGKNDILALLFRGYEGELEARRISERISLKENVELAERAKNLGWQIASRIAGAKDSLIEEWSIDVQKMLSELLGDVITDDWGGDWRGTGLPPVGAIKDALIESSAYRKHAQAAGVILEHLARVMHGYIDEIPESVISAAEQMKEVEKIG